MKQDPIAANQAAILKTRARLLARETGSAAGARKSLEILAFRLASEIYGMESSFVREVHPLRDITPLPGVPAFVLGIASVRGQILSVVDLKVFFNLPGRGLGELNKLIIIRNGRMEFGILADAILGTEIVPVDAIQAAPVTVAGIGAEYIKGITTTRVIVLDANMILCDGKLVVKEVVPEAENR